MPAKAHSNSTHQPTARRIATIEGWLNQPTSTHGQPSEGHTSAVNVLRMVNSRHQHQAAEPVPFRAQGCAGTGGACISHPDCPDVHCEGHPDNMGTASPRKPAFSTERLVWCVVAVYGVLLLGSVALMARG